jgi:hypothetical protein
MVESNIGLFKHVQVETDGVTTWVNTELGCLARFGLRQAEIFKLSPGCESLDGYAFITHSPLTAQSDWKKFVAKMRELYGFEVTDEYMPRRFRG